MEGLPFQPGNTFNDPTKSRHHLSHTLNFKNGYQVPDAYPKVGIGGEPLIVNQLSQSDLDELANFQPSLTYGKAKQAPPENFVPAHVAFDKQVLRFYGYFKETVHESPNEYYRVRPITLYYYLEDDSIAIVEPPVENSGIPQGKLIKRQRLPKNDVGDYYTWKEINLGQNMTVYGRVFRITDSDNFTKRFLESEGVVVNAPEGIPSDPYVQGRQEKTSLRTFATPNAFDQLKQFMEMDRKVLRFYAIWDDRDKMFGEARPFVIHYYLVDDTMEVREIRQPNDGRDPFPVLIRRGKVPLNRNTVDSTFPAAVMELTSQEIKDYISPKDFSIGKNINIYGRKFLLYEADNFTKAWYYQHFGVTDFPTVNVEQSYPSLAKMEIPPYNGYGSLEDSLQNCLTLVPEPPKKDYIKMLDNDHVILRYEAYLDSIKPEDQGRRFIIAYRLGDDLTNIYEPPIRNSGVVGGTFLARTRIEKPQSTPDNPLFYGPQDFSIGACIDVYGTRFIISSADRFVLNYMQEHSHQFPANVIKSIRDKLGDSDPVKTPKKGTPLKVKREAGDLLQLAAEVKSQLKKMAVTDRARVDDMFLQYNRDRITSINAMALKEMCRKMQIPDDDDIMCTIINEHGTDGVMSLEQFRCFMEA